MSEILSSGATGIRTRDTRIFSPLLYQLSYGTGMSRTIFGSFAGAKVDKKIELPNLMTKLLPLLLADSYFSAMKQNFKPGTMIYPLPAVLVSCGASPEEYNLVTVAWTGTLCTDPPMCYISLRRERHSYDIIKRCGEFVINLTTEAMACATDWCGVRSGRDYDKFRETGLTPERASVVAAPAVAESPVSIECRVREIVPLGSHDMFVAEVVNVLVDEQYMNPQTGKFELERAGLIAYSHGEYFSLGKMLGHFGWSVRKPRSRKNGRTKTKK